MKAKKESENPDRENRRVIKRYNKLFSDMAEKTTGSLEQIEALKQALLYEQAKRDSLEKENVRLSVINEVNEINKCNSKGLSSDTEK